MVVLVLVLDLDLACRYCTGWCWDGLSFWLWSLSWPGSRLLTYTTSRVRAGYCWWHLVLVLVPCREDQEQRALAHPPVRPRWPALCLSRRSFSVPNPHPGHLNYQIHTHNTHNTQHCIRIAAHSRCQASFSAFSTPLPAPEEESSPPQQPENCTCTHCGQATQSGPISPNLGNRVAPRGPKGEAIHLWLSVCLSRCVLLSLSSFSLVSYLIPLPLVIPHFPSRPLPALASAFPSAPPPPNQPQLATGFPCPDGWVGGGPHDGVFPVPGCPGSRFQVLDILVPSSPPLARSRLLSTLSSGPRRGAGEGWEEAPGRRRNRVRRWRRRSATSKRTRRCAKASAKKDTTPSRSWLCFHLAFPRVACLSLSLSSLSVAPSLPS